MIQRKDKKIIFIGGTGRSGTNILRKILNQHPEVGSLPFEHRFIIDPDGIIDFYVSFLQGWSPYWADKKITRLEKFLKNLGGSESIIIRGLDKIIQLLDREGKIITPHKYSGWQLNKHIPNFERNTQKLVRELHSFSYKGKWPGMPSYKFSPKIKFAPFYKKKDLQKILSKFLKDNFYGFLVKRGKSIYVEDNTWNILFAKELLELLPEAKILHIMRDPRDVIASLKYQRWAPNNIKQCLFFYKAVIVQWLKIKKKIPRENLIEIKLEELVNCTEDTLRRITEKLNFDYNKKMLNIDLSEGHLGRWKEEFNTQEKMLLEQELESIMNELKYNN
jgi:hypothetical protein